MLITENNINKIDEIGPVQRIVSLVPSLTETIAELGAEKKIVAVTRYCKYPLNIRKTKTVVGGPKNFDTELIFNLHPDVVVGIKEENDKERILQLAEKLPVVVFDVEDLKGAFFLLKFLGKLLQKETVAIRQINEIKEKLASLPVRNAPLKVLYLVWKKPWMAAGKMTFINDMLRICGLSNVAEGRYPAVEEKHFREAEIILLSSEPFPFREKHRISLQQLYPEKKIILVDGEMFSWYGSHLLKASGYFNTLWATLENL